VRLLYQRLEKRLEELTAGWDGGNRVSMILGLASQPEELSGRPNRGGKRPTQFRSVVRLASRGDDTRGDECTASDNVVLKHADRLILRTRCGARGELVGGRDQLHGVSVRRDGPLEANTPRSKQSVIGNFCLVENAAQSNPLCWPFSRVPAIAYWWR